MESQAVQEIFDFCQKIRQDFLLTSTGQRACSLMLGGIRTIAEKYGIEVEEKRLKKVVDFLTKIL